MPDVIEPGAVRVPPRRRPWTALALRDLRWRRLFLPAALALVGGCAAPPDPAEDAPPGFIEDLSPKVVALAAPNQNLDKVRLNPEDRCYWYLHEGPVESVMVPLRAVDGGLICERPGVQTS